jgi:polyhydroxyalkanoate synthesis repressor PhaR
MSTAEQGSQGESVPPEVVTIIRYPNRRLYDRSRGRYVTLRDVEDTIRRGGTVVVRDSKTGTDLTRSLLTQIIQERHPERMELFPITLLHLIIRTDEVMFGFLRDSVRQALQYLEMFQRAAPFNPLLPPQEWLRAFLPGLPLRDRLEGIARHGAETDVSSLLGRIAELERRLDELRNAAEGRPPYTTPRKKKPGGRDRPREDGKE